jgi:hypothetical protein
MKPLSLIAGAVLLVAASWFLYHRFVARQVVSVMAVVGTCKTQPSSVMTAWVSGYPVMAVTPLRFWSTMSYGTLYSSAFLGRIEPSGAIQLVADLTHRHGTRVSGTVLTLRLQGRTEMDLHGRIICSLGPGAVQAMVVDDATSP